MNIIAIFLWYVVIGYLITFVAVATHLFRAELKGFEALNWHEKNTSCDLSSKEDKTNFLIGLLVWPQRIWNLITNFIPYWYSVYERK